MTVAEPIEGHEWLRRANLWRKRTSPRNGSKRLMSVRLYAMQNGKGRILPSIRSAKLAPTLPAGAFFSVYGFTEQIFGTNRQVPRRRASDKEAFGPTSECRGGKGRIDHSVPLCLTCPGRQWLGPFSRSWQRRTNLWRERTNLRTGSERLRGVIRRLDFGGIGIF